MRKIAIAIEQNNDNVLLMGLQVTSLDERTTTTLNHSLYEQGCGKNKITESLLAILMVSETYQFVYFFRDERE
jgi:hypothetical protein